MDEKNNETDDFNFIIRFLNTNLDGCKRTPRSLTAVKGVGMRFATMVCKAAGIDLLTLCGYLDSKQMQRIEKVLMAPLEYNIPKWALNRQKDFVDGTYTQIVSNGLETKRREDLERLKKMQGNRGLRHVWGIRVRGQHTKSTGRRGRTVGVSKKK